MNRNVPDVTKNIGWIGQTEHIYSWSEVRLLVALFATTITFGLFIWERRNLQLCDHYIKCAERIEQESGFDFVKRPDPNKWPRLQKRSIKIKRTHANII